MRASVLEICSTYPAFDFFEKRLEIQTAIHDLMEKELGDNHFKLNHFMIMNVNFPAAFDNEIQQTEIVKQQQQQWIYIKEKEQVSATTKENVAVIDAATLTSVATINGNSVYNKLEAESQLQEDLGNLKVQT